MLSARPGSVHPRLAAVPWLPVHRCGYPPGWVVPGYTPRPLTPPSGEAERHHPS
jgi:hypothetical protein